jgi:hypothetical protein
MAQLADTADRRGEDHTSPEVTRSLGYLGCCADMPQSRLAELDRELRSVDSNRFAADEGSIIAR